MLDTQDFDGFDQYPVDHDIAYVRHDMHDSPYASLIAARAWRIASS